MNESRLRQPDPRPEDDAYEYDTEVAVSLVRTLTVLLALLSPQMLRDPGYDLRDRPFLLVCLAVLIFNIGIGYAAYRRLRLPLTRRPGMLAIDLALATLWVSFTGAESKSELFPLYYLITIVAALWFGVSGALLVAALSTFSYTFACFTGSEEVPDVLRVSLGIHVPFLFLVALSVGYLAQAQEAERRRRAEEQRIRSNLQREVEISRGVQKLLIPQTLPQVAGLDIGAKERTSRQAGGGDYYDVFVLEEDKVAICIADVMGKSLSAQSRLPMLKYALHGLVTQHLPPEQVVSHLNALLYDALYPDMPVTLAYAVVDVKRRCLTLCNAGHPPLLRLSGDGVLQGLRADAPMLGLFHPNDPRYQPYQSTTWTLQAGDVLVFYTDGVVEARSPQHEEFGEERLCAIVAQHRDASAQGIAETIVRAVNSFERSRHLDDVTVVVVKLLPQESTGGR
ncbi:MAG: serine/threonine-protein phosphatase [Abditibacteriales bacterium]|nr:serine/threonine-protein phosphatase [Abditibacteriales bacterium]